MDPPASAILDEDFMRFAPLRRRQSKRIVQKRKTGGDQELHRGCDGEVYNVGGGNHVPNVDLTARILRLLDKPSSLIRHVQDRPGHDRRYALNTDKVRALGWTPAVDFERGLADTIGWYRGNEWWWRPIKGEDTAFTRYYQAQYGQQG